jgi:hypothetical protein
MSIETIRFAGNNLVSKGSTFKLYSYTTATLFVSAYFISKLL